MFCSRNFVTLTVTTFFHSACNSEDIGTKSHDNGILDGKERLSRYVNITHRTQTSQATHHVLHMHTIRKPMRGLGFDKLWFASWQYIEQLKLQNTTRSIWLISIPICENVSRPVIAQMLGTKLDRVVGEHAHDGTTLESCFDVLFDMSADFHNRKRGKKSHWHVCH